MKREGGINDRDDKPRGIDIRMADALAKINPTDPLILESAYVEEEDSRSSLVVFAI